MHQYCKSCGGKTSYDSALPKFCSSCGELFISQTQAPPQNITIANKSIAKISPLFIQTTDQDEDFNAEIPHLETLAFTVKGNDKSNKGIKIKDILGSEAIDTGRFPQQSKGRGRPKKPDNKKIIEEFKAEASPRGRSNPIEITG